MLNFSHKQEETLKERLNEKTFSFIFSSMGLNFYDLFYFQFMTWPQRKFKLLRNLNLIQAFMFSNVYRINYHFNVVSGKPSEMLITICSTFSSQQFVRHLRLLKSELRRCSMLSLRYHFASRMRTLKSIPQ